jgi:hypothetical protein
LAHNFEVDGLRRFYDDRAGFPSARFDFIDPVDASVEPFELVSVPTDASIAFGRIEA